MPKLFDYLDICLFLRAFYEAKRKKNPKFSFASWADQTGFANRALLQMTVKGTRSLSPANSERLKSYFGFNGNEATYFDLLVDLSKAKGAQQKAAIHESILKIQRRTYQQVDVDHDGGLLEDAFHPLILAMTTFNDAPSDATTIAKLLNIPLEQVEKSLQAIASLKEFQEQKGNSYKVADKAHHQGLLKFYEYWLNQSIQAMALPKEVRKYRSLQFALSPEEFEDFNQRMNDFSLTLLNKYHSDVLEERRLYMVKMAAFPVSEKFVKN
jgi:uncharacterized protein (TIGR02147 family)